MIEIIFSDKKTGKELMKYQLKETTLGNDESKALENIPVDFLGEIEQFSSNGEPLAVLGIQP